MRVAVDKLTTEDYFNLFRLGKEQGFNYFFHLHHRQLLFYAKRLLKDDTIAEDIVEDSFLKLFEKREMIRSESTVKTYLFTTLRNACLNWLERNKTKERYQKEVMHSGGFHPPVVEEMIRTEMLSIILQALEELPPATRKVFKMLYIEGKDHHQIAKELNRSPETVRKQRQQGLIFLKKRLLFLFIFFLSHLPVLHFHLVL